MSKRCRGGYRIGTADTVIDLVNEYREQPVTFQARDGDVHFIANPPATNDGEWDVRVADVEKTVVAWDDEESTVEIDDTTLVRVGERLVATRSGVPTAFFDVVSKTATLLTVRLVSNVAGNSPDPDAGDVITIPVDSLFAEGTIETIETKEIQSIKAVATAVPSRVNLITTFANADGHKKKR